MLHFRIAVIPGLVAVVFGSPDAKCVADAMSKSVAVLEQVLGGQPGRACRLAGDDIPVQVSSGYHERG